jgi:hypothetical protein
MGHARETRKHACPGRSARGSRTPRTCFPQQVAAASLRPRSPTSNATASYTQPAALQLQVETLLRSGRPGGLTGRTTQVAEFPTKRAPAPLFYPDAPASNVRPVALGVDAVVVRTPFEDFKVRVQRAAARPVGEQLELARWAASQFWFGIDMGEPAVVRAARELVRLLDGGGFGFGFDRSSSLDPFSPFASPFGGIAARLEEELLAGRLVVERERFAALTEHPQLDFELPPLGPPPRQPAPTTTFIAIHLVDQRAAPLAGRPYRIELPDGSSHEGFTDPDGYGRVAGFTKDGLARVIFLDVDELDFKSKNPVDRIVIPVGDEQESDEERLDDVREALNKPLEDRANEHFVELALFDQDDVPVANELVIVVDASGQEFSAVSDELGNIRVDGLAAGAVKIELRNRDDWSLDTP